MRLTFHRNITRTVSMTSPQIDLHKAFHNLSQLSQIDSFLNSENGIDLSVRKREREAMWLQRGEIMPHKDSLFNAT